MSGPGRWSRRVTTPAGWFAGCCCLVYELSSPAMGATSCPAQGTAVPVVSSADWVYAHLPYAPGERSEYSVRYLGVLAGNAVLTVEAPRMRDGHWYQVYQAEARTGPWYQWAFVGYDTVRAYSLPSGIGYRYFLDQDEQPLFGKHTRKHTEIRMDQAHCTATEIVSEPGTPPRSEQTTIAADVSDVLSTTFRLRTLAYQVGSVVRLPVYASHKSSWIEAEVLAQEQRRVPAGIFTTFPLRLHTHFDDEHSQKREGLIAWVAVDRPEHPLVRLETEISAGSLLFELTQFTPGAKPLPVRSLPTDHE